MWNFVGLEKSSSLWPGAFERGLYVIGGEHSPEVGISFAAIVSLGGCWPDGARCERGRVIYVSGSNVLTALAANGGDGTLIHVIPRLNLLSGLMETLGDVSLVVIEGELPGELVERHPCVFIACVPGPGDFTVKQGPRNTRLLIPPKGDAFAYMVEPVQLPGIEASRVIWSGERIPAVIPLPSVHLPETV